MGSWGGGRISFFELVETPSRQDDVLPTSPASGEVLGPVAPIVFPPPQGEGQGGGCC